MLSIPTVEPSGYRDMKRLQRDGAIVGTVIKNDHGQWGLYDAQKRPMTTRTFASPKLARDAFVEIEMPPRLDSVPD